MSSEELTREDKNLAEMEARENRIKELEAEMIDLKLANEKNLNENFKDRYEELITLEPWNIAAQFQEALETSTTFIRDMSVTQIDELLTYFEGNSPSQKKKNLLQFLKSIGLYRTKDFKKLRNRFFGLKHKGKEALKKNTDNSGFYEYCKQLGFKFD